MRTPRMDSTVLILHNFANQTAQKDLNDAFK